MPWLAALMLSWFSLAAFAQQAPQGEAEVDPPGRVAHISARQGEVVFAPDGEDEWIELPQNRPLTDGDRLWSDRGARAEMQLDTATLHVGGETHVGVSVLDDKATQLILEQGSMNVRLRELEPGENFEVDTPNVAVRMVQPGDYRVDVDDKGGQTRVTVLLGAVTVFGDGSQSINIAAGQSIVFTGRALAQVQGPAFRPDELAQWAGERNRAEEQSVSARYVPRSVVGHAQLDQHGDWQQSPEHGAVWYPRTTPENWAPYRQGRWTHVAPWGWTWVDEAPWGFAPFHYGRWTQVNNRWGWVPGRLAPRPVYSPALVVFLGGGPSASLQVRGGPGVGWYPLAPGEVWWPAFRASPRYFGGVNFGYNVRAYPRGYSNYYWARRPYAVTAVQIGDFRLGRPVYRGWAPLNAQVIATARIGFAPARPTRVELRAVHGSAVVRLQARPASVRTVGAAHFADRRKQEIRSAGRAADDRGNRAQAAGRGADERGNRAQAAGRGGDERGNRAQAAGRGDGDNRQPQRAAQRDQQRGGNDDRASNRPNPRGDNDRAARRQGDDNDRGARQGAREDRPGRGPEAREERGGGRGPEAGRDRPGRGPQAREERGGGRGPEAREERGRGAEVRQEREQRMQQRQERQARQERAERPEAAQPQRPERAEAPRQQRAEQPQREAREQRGGGRARDKDDDERPRR
ncbi:DUF6600 domain-containing protein [Ramlibacter sp. PS3R-8]|uniref:DUF6600 domain-containing protein n=1 Tax=Ramlibacter sp. PS3R-8 TaxID=3133437 RepID=UPI003097EF8D